MHEIFDMTNHDCINDEVHFIHRYNNIPSNEEGD